MIEIICFWYTCKVMCGCFTVVVTKYKMYTNLHILTEPDLPAPITRLWNYSTQGTSQIYNY